MPNENTLWLLDPGHGGIVNGLYVTAGKRSPQWDDGTQLFEGVYNREIVDRMIRYCLAHNINYYNIVPEEKDISLTTRVSRANEIMSYCAKQKLDIPIVYLSVHGNAGGGTGWEIWTSPGETKSDMIAATFFDEFEKGFSSYKFRMRKSDDGKKDKEAKFTVINDTWMPAVLTENLFYDTYTPDYQFMTTDIGKNTIALLHIKSMLAWNGVEYNEIPPFMGGGVLPRTNFKPIENIF